MGVGAALATTKDLAVGHLRLSHERRSRENFFVDGWDKELPTGKSAALLIFVGHHDGDGGRGVVDVHWTGDGEQLHQFCGSVVVADVEREGQAGNSGSGFLDGKAEHPDNVPKPSGFILSTHVWRHGDVGVEYRSREENGKTDSGFLRGFGDFDLFAVGDSLGAGVTVDDFAKGGDAVGDFFRLAEYGGQGFDWIYIFVCVHRWLTVEDWDFGLC